MDHITMSRKEINQVAVFEKLKKREVTQVVAAQMLEQSEKFRF